MRRRHQAPWAGMETVTTDMEDFANRPLRIAFLGLVRSSWTARGPALRLCQEARPDRIEPTGIYHSDAAVARNFAAEFGFRQVYDDPGALLDDGQFDAVVAIPTVPAVGAAMPRLFAQGRPVFLERMASMGSRCLSGLLEHARAHQTPNMVAFNRRFTPAFLKARQWLRENVSDTPVDGFVARDYRGYHSPTRLISAALRMAPHPVGLAQDLLGSPSQIIGLQSARTRKDSPVHAGLASYRQGGTASFVIAPQAGEDLETYGILGEDYTIQIDVVHCGLTIQQGRQVMLSWTAPLDSPPAFRGGALGQTEAFLGAVREGRPMSPDLAESVMILKTAEALIAGGQTDFPADATGPSA